MSKKKTVKCRKCKAELLREEAYKVEINGTVLYYCNEEEANASKSKSKPVDTVPKAVVEPVAFAEEPTESKVDNADLMLICTTFYSLLKIDNHPVVYNVAKTLLSSYSTKEIIDAINHEKDKLINKRNSMKESGKDYTNIIYTFRNIIIDRIIDKGKIGETLPNERYADLPSVFVENEVDIEMEAIEDMCYQRDMELRSLEAQPTSTLIRDRKHKGTHALSDFSGVLESIDSNNVSEGTIFSILFKK